MWSLSTKSTSSFRSPPFNCTKPSYKARRHCSSCYLPSLLLAKQEGACVIDWSLHRPRALTGRQLHILCRAAGFCFDATCQREKDTLFLLSLALPVVLASLSFLFLGRKQSGEDTFESKDGTVFQSPPGIQPERDKKGELAYRAVSYTPWPVEEGAEGDRLRVNVGPLGRQQKQTYVFERVLPQPSRVLSVSLPRPMGVVFEEDSRSQRLIVCDLVEGSTAYQRAQVAKMDRVKQESAVLAGDVLRACTCTNFVYQTTALFGAKAPERTIVLYGADNQKWSKVINALKRGSNSDGDVTLVLERSLQS